MEIATFVFYLFAAVTVLSALMVISAKNPVHSVLFLILAFFSTAGLFVLLGAEYLAMTLVIVYVGAVAILFLFVVMMLNVNFAQMKEGFLRYLPIGIGVAVVLLAELVSHMAYSLIDGGRRAPPSSPAPADVSNVEALGRILYTDYVYLFQIAGIILLVAMIGAIVLTLRQREGVRKQNIVRQVSRRREDCVALVDVKTGAGI